MARTREETVICTYRVQPGREEAFLALVARHWPVLRRLRLATAARPRVFVGHEADGKPFVVEIFTWRDAGAVEDAHVHPAVQTIWSEMGTLVEERGGRPGWEFPHVQPVKVKHPRIAAPARKATRPRSAGSRRTSGRGRERGGR